MDEQTAEHDHAYTGHYKFEDDSLPGAAKTLDVPYNETRKVGELIHSQSEQTSIAGEQGHTESSKKEHHIKLAGEETTLMAGSKEQHSVYLVHRGDCYAEAYTIQQTTTDRQTEIIEIIQVENTESVEYSSQAVEKRLKPEIQSEHQSYLPSEVLKARLDLSIQPIIQDPSTDGVYGAAVEPYHPDEPNPPMEGEIHPAKPYPPMEGEIHPAKPYPPMQGEIQPAEPYAPMQGEIQPTEPYPTIEGEIQPAEPYPAIEGYILPAEPYPAIEGDVQPAEPYPAIEGDIQPAETYPAMQREILSVKQSGPAQLFQEYTIPCSKVELGGEEEIVNINVEDQEEEEEDHKVLEMCENSAEKDSDMNTSAVMENRDGVVRYQTLNHLLKEESRNFLNLISPQSGGLVLHNPQGDSLQDLLEGGARTLLLSYCAEKEDDTNLNFHLANFVKIENTFWDRKDAATLLQYLSSANLCEGVEEKTILPLLKDTKQIAIFTIEKSGETFKYRTRQCEIIAKTGRLCNPCSYALDSVFSVFVSDSDVDEEYYASPVKCKKKVICCHCSKLFTSQVHLEKHLRSVDKSFVRLRKDLRKKCLYCDEEFQMKSKGEVSHKYVQHLKSVHSKHTADPAFKRVIDLHELKTLKCEQCFKTFVHSRSKELHMRLAHPGAEETIDKLSCHVCGKFFKTPSTLHGHMRTHDSGSYICAECGASFKVRSYLYRHALSHSQENKRFECDLCSKKFSQPYLMRQHKEFSHMKNLPFKCDECGKTTRTKTRLNIHIRAVHTKEKPFPCEVCGFKSARMDNLNIHRLKMHNLIDKLTRANLKLLVTNGKHQFCQDPRLIPDF